MLDYNFFAFDTIPYMGCVFIWIILCYCWMLFEDINRDIAGKTS